MQRFFDGTLLLVSTIAVVTACGGGGKSDNGGSGGGTSNGTGGSSTGQNGGASTTAGAPGNGGMSTANGGASSTSGGASTTSGGASTTSGGASTTSGGATSDGAGGSTAGASAKGGATSTGGAASGGSGGATTTSEAVLERNNSPTRDGHFKQPTLTKAAVGKMAADADFKSTLIAKGETSSDMRSSPLYMSNGPGGKAAYFATTTNNDVFAIDAASGAQLWVKNIGSSPSANQPSGAKCGDIHPLGILSTPVIDATKRTLYTVGAVGTTSITTFELHAIGIDDGMEKSGYPIDLSMIPSDKMANVYHHNQRGALSLVSGVVYVPFGGHVGDCGTYNGRVIAVDTNDTTKRGSWQTRHAGEAIWAPGGLASDGNGVLAITGNYTPFGQHAASRDMTDSEEVIRLTGLATLTRSNANLYYATDWQNMDDSDADFGAMNPLVLNVPGSTPSSLVAALSKDGRIHLLDSANLGGADGKTPLQSFKVASATNNVMLIHTVPAAYKTATSTYITFSTDAGAMCPTGQPSGKVVMGVAVTAGAPPTLKVAWCAALTGTVTAPIATTTDGSANAAVWFISNNKLTAVDGDTGAVLYTSADSCSGVQKWTSPIAANGHIVVGAKDKLCSWSPH